MRGADIQQDTLFSTVIPEGRVPADHPLRAIRNMVNAALKELDTDFNALYPDMGRDSIHRRSYSGRSCSWRSTRYAASGN